MIRRLAVLPFLYLSACSVGAPSFDVAPATRIEVEGSVFDVRVAGAFAQAVRRNPSYAPRPRPTNDLARRAMEQVSGCQVLALDGDQSLSVGALSCPGRKTPAPAVRGAGPARYDCMEIATGIHRSDGGEYVDYECTPY